MWGRKPGRGRKFQITNENTVTGRGRLEGLEVDRDRKRVGFKGGNPKRIWVSKARTS